MALTSGLNQSAVRTAIDAVFKPEFNMPALAWEADVNDELVFRQKETDREAWITEEYAGPGYFQVRGERQDVAEGTPRITNQRTTAIKNYALSVPISKNFFDDQKFDLIRETARMTAVNARQTRKKEAFKIYNNGFTTQTTNDSVAVFSNSHSTIGGTTLDNLETGVLSVANLETCFNSLINQVGHDGVVVGHAPKFLLVPTDLLREAQEITKSELISNSANNALNYYSYAFPGLQVKYSPFLTAAQGGSATAYFVGSQYHGMCRVNRQDLQTGVTDWNNTLNNDYIYKYEYREAYDSISMLGLIGSNGTV